MVRLVQRQVVVRAGRPGRPRGVVVDLLGRIVNQAGETAVGAKGRVLVADHL